MEPTVKERQVSTLSYSAPVAGVSAAVALLFTYFASLPADVAIAITVVAGFVFNQVYDLVRYYIDKKKLAVTK